MKHVERRRQNCEELLPEVLALIVSCGGPIRKGDLRAIEIAQLQQETHLRWHAAKASHHVIPLPDALQVTRGRVVKRCPLSTAL